MFWALSRREAELHNPAGDRRHVIISITDPETKANPRTTDATVGLIRLQFDDFRCMPRSPRGAAAVIGVRPVKLFTTRMAQEVVSYLRSRSWRSVVVHCEAGASRSVAMAHALSEHYGLDFVNMLPNGGDEHELERIARDKGWPSWALKGNSLVYNLMLAALSEPTVLHVDLAHPPSEAMLKPFPALATENVCIHTRR